TPVITVGVRGAGGRADAKRTGNGCAHPWQGPAVPFFGVRRLPPLSLAKKESGGNRRTPKRATPKGPATPPTVGARVAAFLTRANTPGAGAAPRRPDSSPRQRRPPQTTSPAPPARAAAHRPRRGLVFAPAGLCASRPLLQAAGWAIPPG